MEQRIGSFQVERELGRGGMGIVYLATDPRLERITRKPIQADPEEKEANPRSRSARLRLARRVHGSEDLLEGGRSV